MGVTKTVLFTRSGQDINLAKEFKHYKAAIRICPPKRLEDGGYLHTYRVTEYDDQDAQGVDLDEEQEAFNREL